MENAERSPDIIYKTCNGPLCNGTNKLISEFPKKRSICKICFCHTIKEYHKKNGRAYRNCKNELKSKTNCVECGCDDIRLLEFDHTGYKNVTIAKSFSKAKIIEEAKLTQMLCIWCHRLKTRTELDKQMEAKDFSISERPVNESDGRRCIGELCQDKLQYKTAFYVSQHKSFCKICLSYQSRLQRQKNYEFLVNMKLEQKECALCKKQVTTETASCFDYDHLRDKSTELATLVRKSHNTQQQMIDEAKKCRLLCCKCHKLFTIEQMNYNY